MPTPRIPACPSPRAQGPRGNGRSTLRGQPNRSYAVGTDHSVQILDHTDGHTKLREGEELI